MMLSLIGVAGAFHAGVRIEPLGGVFIGASIVGMLAGQVVEQGATAALLGQPNHPYTRRLLQDFALHAPALEATP